MSSNYQKVYMNQIHSSSLLCQLAQLWKNQQLCDAIIRTGSVVTKAHRVVLVAACPMLQSMENASFGSHLEVRLAAEIKQDSVNTFLQYLYEGFMMLTEENVRDVEKIAKLLQVENIITCCSDFDKCLRTKQGMPPHSSQYKYNYHDQVEFRHVRTTDLQKTFHERMMKRASEMSRPASPGHKRPRMHKSANSDLSNYGANRMDDSSAMSQGYHGHTMSGPGSGGSGGDTWERIPKLNPGFQSSRSSSFSRSSSADPGVVEIREDSVEIIQTEQPEPGHGQSEPKSKSVAISVAGQMNNEYDLQIVNVSAGDTESKTGTKASSTSSRAPITVSPLSVHSDSSSSPIIKDNSSHHPPPPKLERSGQLTQSRDENRRRSDYHLQTSQNRSDSDMYSHSPSRQRIEEQKRQSYSQRSESDIYSEDKGSHRQPYPVTMSSAGMSKQFTSGSVQSKPFAAGSIMQANSPMPSPGSSHKSATSSNQERQESSEMPLGQMSSGVDKLEQQASSSADLTPDLSIVKIESANNSNMDDTGGLDMYVDMPDQSMISHMQGDEEVPDDHSDYEQPSGDWGQEDMSNEGSNISGDQSMYMGNMKEGFYAEYLVQFGELSRNVKSYFKDNLEDVIRRQFHIDPEQPLMVQYFDREWNMWTNCNWDNITPGSKLRVSYGGGGQGMDMYQTQPDDNSMFLMPDSEFTTVLPNFVQRRWPDVYRLPMEKIEMDILMVLDQGFCPQERRLTRFLDAIYEDATRYTFYPQGIHYEEMANAILDKWPHLVTEKPGMTMAEAKVLWKRRLCQKFQNSRKRRDKNIAEVQLKRKNKNFR